MLTALRHWVVPHPGNAYHPRALHHRTLFSTSLALILVKALVVGALLGAYPTPASFSSLTTARILALTNAARKGEALPPLTVDARLSRGALDKARDMLAHQYFDHDSPDGTSSWYWFTKEGYRYDAAGENLAAGFDSSEELVAAWLDSPAHAANILGDAYEDTGIAVVTGKLFGETTTVAVQLFGATEVQETPAVAVAGRSTGAPPNPAPANPAAPALEATVAPPSPVSVAPGPAIARTVPWSKVAAAAALSPTSSRPVSGPIRVAAFALPRVIEGVLAAVLLLLGATLFVHARPRHVPLTLHALAMVGLGLVLIEAKLHFLEDVLAQSTVVVR